MSHNALNLTHGQVLTPSECATGVASRPYKYRLSKGDGTIVADWDSIEANDLRKLIVEHKLKLSFRYLNPAVTPITDAGQKMFPHLTRYAVLEIQFPQQGRFHTLHVNQIRAKFATEMRAVEKTFGSSLMPSSLGIYHFVLLSAIIKQCQEINQKFLTPRQQTTTANQASLAIETNPGNSANRADSYIKRLLESVDQEQLQQIATVARNLSLPSSSNMNTASGSGTTFSPNLFNFNPQIPSTSAQVTPMTHMPPGAWPLASASGNLNGLDEDALLSHLEMMNQSTYDDSDEPIDADMQDILNNMADGNFHGSDALATLYGDRGVDVAKLSLYSDTESLKKRGLKSALHDHQLQGLLWMIKAEHRRVSKTDGKAQALWMTRLDVRGKPYYVNLATRKCRRIAPVLPRGGINSDSMGLGKTIQSKFESLYPFFYIFI